MVKQQHLEIGMTLCTIETNQGDSGGVAENQIVGYMWKSLSFALLNWKILCVFRMFDAVEMTFFRSNLTMLWKNK